MPTRAQQAERMRQQGAIYQQIADALGYGSRSAAFRAVARAPRERIELEERAAEAARAALAQKKPRMQPPTPAEPARCYDCDVVVSRGRRCRRCRYRARIGKRVGPRKVGTRAGYGASARERFDVKVEPAKTPGGCTLWTGALDKVTHGYGQFGVDGKTVRVHRWIWEEEHGPIPQGMTIEHMCGVTACVNTAHMELLTHAENASRGRRAQIASRAAA